MAENNKSVLEKVESIAKEKHLVKQNVDSLGLKVDAFQEELKRIKEDFTADINKEREQRIVQNLSDEMIELQQYSRFNNVVISGIRDDKTIDTYEAVKGLAEYLGVNIKKEHIDIAHRRGTRSNIKDRPIIVKFANRWVKEELMIAKKQKMPNLTTADLGYTQPSQNVYLSDHLSPYLQLVHYKARQLEREKMVNAARSQGGNF